MRKLILMTSTAILIPFSVQGTDITCTPTKDCASLGYTETSCPDNNGVKCPWGEAWFCPPPLPEVCEIGSILYSDMTCFKEAKSNKTPIGVVIYVDGLGGGQALALESAGEYQWGIDTYIPEITNKNVTEASMDFASCENSRMIMWAGDKNVYPAVWAAHEYSTEGTSAGDWCLPAAGVLESLYDNRYTIIYNKYSLRSQLEKLGIIFSSSKFTWSSTLSYPANPYALHWQLAGNQIGGKENSSNNDVYPIFEFVQTFDGVCSGSQQYTCVGSNETGGLGEACGGKYNECSCAEGYEWWQGKCTPNCEIIGNILYSDKTCSKELDTGKTPIGVVVYVDRNGGGQALALNSIGEYKWGNKRTDISGLTNYTEASDAATDFASCVNSKIIMAAGDKSKYPAVWAANEYSTEGTSAGDWCLPAAGIFTSYYNHYTYVNNGLERANGTKMNFGETYTCDTAWSSTENSSLAAWRSCFTGSIASDIYGLTSGNTAKNTYSYEVRPVIEF